MLKHKVFGDEDGGSLALVDVVGVLGVGKESDAVFVDLFDAAWFINHHVLVAFDDTAQFAGYFFGCELHDR